MKKSHDSKYESMEFVPQNDYNTKRYSLIHQHTAILISCYFVCFILGYTMIKLKCSLVNHMVYLPPLIQMKQKKYMKKCNYLKPDTVMMSL